MDEIESKEDDTLLVDFKPGQKFPTPSPVSRFHISLFVN